MQDGILASGAKSIRAGLVGCGIGRSRTPAMHMAEGNARNLDFEYSLIDLDGQPEMLSQVLDKAEQDGFAGVNITFPFKVDVIPLLDELSDNARILGAVNTVVFRDGKRLGHNTDLWGFSESFRREMPNVATGKVLLLGAGGAGMAVAHALLAAGVKHLIVFDKDADRAEKLAAALIARFGANRAASALSVETHAADIDGLVNATPIGMDKLPGCPFPKPLLRSQMWVADIIYFPLETELLAAARKAGCQTLSGSGMAVFQAVRAFQLFTGIEPQHERMRATFEAMGS